MPVLTARPSCGSAAAATRSTSCSSSRTAGSADLVLAMSHEETLTFHMAREVRSYRDLPKMLYHFQIKERDEPRPRAGRAAHARVHHEGLLLVRPRRGGPGRLLRPARAGLRPDLRPRRARVVPGGVRRGDDGRHRRARVHGAVRRRARTTWRSRTPATPPTWRWRAPRRSPVDGLPEALDAPEPVDTPGATTIEQVSQRARRPAGALMKALPMVREDGAPLLVVVRGDHRLNEIKLQNALGQPARPATEEEMRDALRRPAGLHRPRGRAGAGARRRGAARG